MKVVVVMRRALSIARIAKKTAQTVVSKILLLVIVAVDVFFCSRGKGGDDAGNASGRNTLCNTQPGEPDRVMAFRGLWKGPALRGKAIGAGRVASDDLSVCHMI